jgi:hypothetical protein
MISEMQTGTGSEAALPNRSLDFLEKPGIMPVYQPAADPPSVRFTAEKSAPAGNQ